MSRLVYSGLAVLCLLLQGSAFAAAGARLTWTYPCSFQYSNGTPYAKPPSALECDYMRTQLDHAAQQFNAKPTLESQSRFLQDMLPAADDHIAAFETARDAILARTDPSNLPALAPDSDRMRMLLEFKQDLENSAQQACEPFLWQRFFEPSYLDDKSNGAYPDSWKPCMGAFEERMNALDAAIAGGTPPILRDEDEKARAQFASAGAGSALSGAATALQSSQDPAETLNTAFDGGATSSPSSAVRVPPSGAGGNAPAAVPGSAPRPAPPPPPPAPEDARQVASRNYFMRGYDAGMQRIADDAQIQLWHWTGRSRTVGEPDRMAAWTVYEEGPSCDIAAVAEVLESHGQNIAVKALAEEASDMGIYAEETLRDGDRVGGMHDANLDKLLLKHGVNASFKKNATPQDLETDIRRSGLALAVVDSQSFWNDPDASAASGHVVLVTGLEQTPGGAVLGYYVNDPGTGEGARYVSKADFLRAWSIRGNPLVSIPR